MLGMKNGDKQVYPYEHINNDGTRDNEYGLTKREYFAGLAMQGLCAGRTEYEQPGADAEYAVKLADALLNELDKPNKNETD